MGRAGRAGLVLQAAWGVLGCTAAPPPLDGPELYAWVHRASVSLLWKGRHQGSGFFAGPDGLLLTAAHAVRGKADGLEILSPAAGRRSAERVALDLGHDLALLRAANLEGPVPWLPIADALPPPAAEIHLFGDPVFRRGLLLTGFVSVAEPRYSYCGGTGCYIRCYYVAGTSPEGTSGGCWVDRHGRVVGVQSGYLNAPKAPAVIAMVAPPDAIRRLLNGKTPPPTPTLGTLLEDLWTQPEGFIARFPPGTRGVATVAPEKDGPAAQAGLTKESLITAADGRPVSDVDELMALVRAKKPGDAMTLEVLDPDGRPARRVTVVLAAARE